MKVRGKKKKGGCSSATTLNKERVGGRAKKELSKKDGRKGRERGDKQPENVRIRFVSGHRERKLEEPSQSAPLQDDPVEIFNSLRKSAIAATAAARDSMRGGRKKG